MKYAINDETGEGDINGESVVESSIKKICAGGPCYVFPGAPTGYNKFHVRALLHDGWSLWSNHRNFLIGEPGFLEHKEL